jgi:DNA-3-methyladenine glycosylase
MAPVPVELVARDPRLVAPDLLGLLLCHHRRVGRIVEVEAYCGAEDPAAHTYRGRTTRNATMYGRAGLLYVYRSYGLHWCANVVCGGEGEGVAVLLRALLPVDGLEEMRVDRSQGRRPGPPLPDRDLCRGPGRLTQALAINGAHDGADLLAGDRGVRLEDDGWRPPEVAQGVRVGISVAADRPWRWWVAGSPAVSRGPRAVTRH